MMSDDIDEEKNIVQSKLIIKVVIKSAYWFPRAKDDMFEGFVQLTWKNCKCLLLVKGEYKNCFI